MKVAFFDTHQFDKDAFSKANKDYNINIDFHESCLNFQSAVLADASNVVCSFVNDKIDDECIEKLQKLGVKLIALRSAGFNHVDLISAQKHGIQIARVPSYSPHSIAEFATGLLLSLNRKIHRAYGRVRELNFSLDGLVGISLYGKTVGVIGTGKIGKIFAEQMVAFGCKVLVNDINKNSELEGQPNIQYTSLEDLYTQSDIISLHLPLTPQTHYLINEQSINSMKDGVVILNTGRGALIDSKALISGLKNGKIGGAALDVYEEEENLFFKDLSNIVLKDDVLARLLSFPNVLMTSHQAFLTKEALECIAKKTLENIDTFNKTGNAPKDRIVTVDGFLQVDL
jgi:D-lactate dehydrogenase